MLLVNGNAIFFRVVEAFVFLLAIQRVLPPQCKQDPEFWI